MNNQTEYLHFESNDRSVVGVVLIKMFKSMIVLDSDVKRFLTFRVLFLLILS